MWNSVLKLTLNKEWFDLILSGEKEAEYREIKPYWIRRLIWNKEDMEALVFDEFCEDLKNWMIHFTSLDELFEHYGADFKKFNEVVFTNGYSNKSPKVRKEISFLDIGIGKKEWGAPEYPVFIIRLGRELGRKN